MHKKHKGVHVFLSRLSLIHQEAADKLAYSVANKVYDLAGGVDERPAPGK
jgi:hypothetical protein